jgi:DNA-directed RNA polymerase subunit RPC12/RpoP
MANQYKCEECGATFSSEAALDEHNRNMHSQYRCQACGQMFSSESELEAHNRVAHPEEEQTPRS